MLDWCKYFCYNTSESNMVNESVSHLIQKKTEGSSFGFFLAHMIQKNEYGFLVNDFTINLTKMQQKSNSLFFYVVF